MKPLLQRPWMPFLIALGAGLAIIVLAFLPALWQTVAGTGPRPEPDTASRPWDVRADGRGGVVAFGLKLPGSTLAELNRRWGDELQLGVIARRGEPGALEGYVDTWRDGGVTGKMVFALGATPAQVAAMRERSPREQVLDADARRYVLAAADREATLSLPLVGLSFVPSVQLDAATLAQRFGPPDERLPAGEGAEQWLYPSRGLAIALHEKGRELIQVVAPADFERRLRAPLLAASAPR